MTQDEFDLINQLGSQLEHFVAGDALQMPEAALRELLDRAELALSHGRARLIRERDFGHM